MSEMYLVVVATGHTVPLNVFLHEAPCKGEDGFNGDFRRVSLDWDQAQHPDWWVLGVSPTCEAEYKVFPSEPELKTGGVRHVPGHWGVWSTWAQYLAKRAEHPDSPLT